MSCLGLSLISVFGTASRKEQEEGETFLCCLFIETTKEEMGLVSNSQLAFVSLSVLDINMKREVL